MFDLFENVIDLAQSKKTGGGSAELPFGETTTVKEVLAECQPEFNGETYILPDNVLFVAGEKYIVTWNGVEYTCVAQDASMAVDGMVAVGNASGFGLNGAGEPFLIGGIPGVGANVQPLDGSTTLTISIRQEVTEVKKIDAKYLPDGIGGECDWNTMKNKPFDKRIDTSWYGETIIESLTATVDENGAKTIYGDEYGFEMNLPFDTGDSLCISVVSQEDGETYLYSSKGAAYEDGVDVYSSIVRADFEIKGRTVSISVSNTAGYMTVINLSGFEPNSEVKFGLHHALVEYRPIDMRYLPTTVMSTDKAVYGFLMKNYNDQTFRVSVSDDGQLVVEEW